MAVSSIVAVANKLLLFLAPMLKGEEFNVVALNVPAVVTVSLTPSGCA
jgi:hypothetical protein